MATTPVIQTAHHRPQPPSGRKGGFDKPQKQRTRAAIADGFLRHRFLPLWNSGGGDWRQMEREFFNSLSNLCKLYGWRLPTVTGMEFPSNIWKAYAQIEKKCGERKLDCMIVADSKRRAVIATSKTYDTGYTLYYIPVRPLWKMLNAPQERPITAAILELSRYLCQISGVTFCEQGSYIMSEYETIENWVRESEGDGEEDYRQPQLAELKLLATASKELEPILKYPYLLERLQQALAAYERSADWDLGMGMFLKNALQFCKDYPSHSIAATMGCIPDGEPNEQIYVDQYLSFYWSGTDCLNELLIEMVSNELQEYGLQQQPLSIQCFDHIQKEQLHDFSYEQRFFELVERFIELLNDLDDEECNE